MHRHQVHVSVVEGVQGADVAPVAAVPFGGAGHLVVVEVIDGSDALAHQSGNDVAAHVVIGVVVVGVSPNGVDQDFGGENVVAHRDERLLGIIGRARRIGRFLHELPDLTGLVGVDTAESARLRPRHPDPGDGHPSATVDVELHHLLRIHPVHMVGPEHHDVVGVLVVDEVQRLVDGIGRTGVPARPEALLGRHRSDVLPRQATQPPVLGDVPVQGVRLVLGQHADPQIAGVHQVGQHEIDESVGATEGDRGLGPVRGQRVKAFALAPGQDDSQHVWQLPHAANLTATAGRG